NNLLLQPTVDFLGPGLFFCAVEQFAEPIVYHAIDHQMDPVCLAFIDYLMDKVCVYIPTGAWLHVYSDTIYVKFNLRIGNDRKMEARLPLFKCQVMIAVCFDFGTRCGPKQRPQPYSL